MNNPNEHLVLRTRDAVTQTAPAESVYAHPWKPIWYILASSFAFLLLLVLTLLMLARVDFAQQGAQKAAAVASFEKNELRVMNEKIAAFDVVNIEGQAGYVLDVTTDEVLFERNADLLLPLASVTKVMSALVLLDYLDFDETVTITLADMNVEGVSGFYLGEQWRAGDLLDFSLMTSSNDGIHALARTAGERMKENENLQDTLDPVAVFVARMNTVAQGIGMHSARFVNPTGLDISETQGGAYASARDVATLMRHITLNQPDVLFATAQSVAYKESLSQFVHTASNTNAIVERLPGIRASKTGYTDLAGGNLAVVYDSGFGTPIVVVVLGSSIDGRFADVEELVWASLNSVSIR